MNPCSGSWRSVALRWVSPVTTKTIRQGRSVSLQFLKVGQKSVDNLPASNCTKLKFFSAFWEWRPLQKSRKFLHVWEALTRRFLQAPRPWLPRPRWFPQKIINYLVFEDTYQQRYVKTRTGKMKAFTPARHHRS